MGQEDGVLTGKWVRRMGILAGKWGVPDSPGWPGGPEDSH